MRIIFEMFIFAGVMSLFSRNLAAIFRRYAGISQHATARFTAPTR